MQKIFGKSYAQKSKVHLRIEKVQECRVFYDIAYSYKLTILITSWNLVLIYGDRIIGIPNWNKKKNRENLITIV